jgi:hypothetical protein
MTRRSSGPPRPTGRLLQPAAGKRGLDRPSAAAGAASSITAAEPRCRARCATAPRDGLAELALVLLVQVIEHGGRDGTTQLRESGLLAVRVECLDCRGVETGGVGMVVPLRWQHGMPSRRARASASASALLLMTTFGSAASRPAAHASTTASRLLPRWEARKPNFTRR